MKLLSRLACLGLLSLFSLTRAEAQNSFECGNLNQRACQHSDWARMNLVTGIERSCEIDLRESGGYCVDYRRNLAGIRRSQWAAWALEQQLLGIGNDTPLNFLSWPAAQRAYANEAQGYSVILGQQILSITDQLNAGVRLLVFDLRHFASGGSGEALRLCRAETGTECGLSLRFRLFGYALQEVANWVDANPGQVVLVRLYNFDLSSQQVAAAYDEVQRTLGERVYPNPGTPERWPTPGEMRAAGKPVLVAQFYGSVSLNSAWVWNARRLIHSSDRLSDQNLVGCVASDGMEMSQRWHMQPFSWWDVAVNTLDAVGMRNAVRCGVASLGMTRVSATDVRLPAMVWSWAEGDWGRNGAAMLNRDGRWNSGPETQALPVACALRREAGSPRQDRGWQVTREATAWSVAAGEALCAREFGSGYTFAAPENAYQNHALTMVATGRQVWLRHKVAELPSLSLSARKMVFQMQPGGTVPAAQTLLMGGTPGTPVRIRVMPGLPLTVSANAGTLSPSGLPLEVGLGSGLWLLPPGVHRGGVELTVMGQTTVVEVELIMRAAPTLSVVAEPATAEPEEAVSLRLQLMNTFQPQGEYSISRVTNGGTEFLTKGVMTSSFGSMAQARVTLPNLPLGTHTLLAMVAGDARNLPASALRLTVTIRKRLAANPAAVEWRMVQGGALPTRDVAVTGLGLRPVALTGCSWINATMAGSTLQLAARGAVRELVPGTHRCEVIVGDDLTMQRGVGHLVVPVTLVVQATLTAQPVGEILVVGDEFGASSLNLATSATGGLDLSVTVSAPWLQVTPPSGARAPGAFRITAVGAALPYGRHRGEVVFRSAVTPELRVPIVFDRVKPTIIETNPANMPFKVDGTTYTGGAVFSWSIGSIHQLEMLEQRGESVRQIPSGWTIQGRARTGASTTVEATEQGGVLLAIYTGWFRLQLLPDSNGTIGVTSSVPPNGEFYPHGARVELVGQPKIGFGNMTWSVDSGFGQVTSNEQKIPLTIFSPTIARVQFHPQEVRRVEITANVPGVSATVDGVVTSLPAYFTWYPRSQHTIVVTQTMPINEQSRRGFMAWENGNTNFSRQISMPDSPLQIQATYGMEHLVTVTPSPAVGGSVQGAGWYREGAPVILRAIPASGYVFAGYSGNVTSTQALTPVTVTGPLNVVAHFTLGTIAGHAAAGGGQRHPDAPVLWRRRWMV